MPILDTLQIKIAAVVGIVFLVIVVGFAAYFNWSQHQLKLNAGKLAAYEISIQEQEKTITELFKNIEDIKAVSNRLTDIERNNFSQSQKLNQTLSKLENVAAARPGLVENLINNAAKDRNRCFALATGAVPEKNEKNRVCPQLLTEKK